MNNSIYLVHSIRSTTPATSIRLACIALSVLVVAPVQAQSKHHINDSMAQYIVRENGAFEINFLYPNGGAPLYGLADVMPITARESIRLLDLSDSQVTELVKIRKQMIAARKQAQEQKSDTRQIEDAYRDQVLKVIDERQTEQWHWLNRRNVFFSGGLVNFLSRKDVRAGLNLTDEQLQEVIEARHENATWLKSKINKLFRNGIEKGVGSLTAKQTNRVADLLNFDQWEKYGIIGTPSTLFWFATNEKNAVVYEPKLGFVQTVWRLNLNSELVATHGSSYTTGMSNLTRFYWYYQANFGNQVQAAEIVKELEYLGSIRGFYTKFFQRDENKEVPFIEFMNKLFRYVREHQEENSFDRFVFLSQVQNIGLVNTLRNRMLFEDSDFRSEEITKIKDNRQQVAELLREQSNAILSDLITLKLSSLSVSQRESLKDMLIPSGEEAISMVPLEIVYLGIVMGNADRVSYRRGLNNIIGFRLPDYDLMTEQQKELIKDPRQPRLSPPNVDNDEK